MIEIATSPATTTLVITGDLDLAEREQFPEIGEKPDARTVFVKLRELRNRW